MKILRKSFISDQSQVCISNGLEARALQSEALICKNAVLHRDCKTEMGKVFTQTNAISKRKKKMNYQIGAKWKYNGLSNGLRFY